MMKRFDPYHEMGEPRERRMAVVSLRSWGWTPRSIASYPKVHKSTIYWGLRRWSNEGDERIARRETALWLSKENLTVEYAG